MPWWLESDTFHDDPLFVKLAEQERGPLYDRLKLSYCELKSFASHHTTNGYLLEHEALRFCRQRRVLELLCTSALDRPPLVHRKGDVCDCLGEDWTDGYDYRLHAFLKRNPARAEVERNRAQRADLRDARLKGLVYARDGGCCRYCRSGPLSPKAVRSRDRRKVLSYDHVDPDRPAGADGGGLVVACGACNEWKGHRTPDEADMVLLPVPSDGERAVWEARGLALFDRSDAPRDHRPITNESPTNQRPITDRNGDAIGDGVGDRAGDPNTDGTGELRPDAGDRDRDQPVERPPGGAGSGRAAGADGGGPDPPSRRASGAQPPRTSADPDIYTRRSRASPGYEGWPAGSVPATPRHREENDDP